MQPLRRVGLATGTLTSDEIYYIEKQITKTVRPLLVGRLLMPTIPLAHAGFKSYKYYTESDMSQALISMTGEGDSMDIVPLAEGEVVIPIIHKDYLLHWRDVIMARNNGRDLNTQHAENAARQCAEEEDKLILSGEYTGNPALGIQGLTTKTGRQTQVGGDWSANYLTYVSGAKQLLRAAGYYGPYRLVITSTFYSQLEVLIANTEKFAFQALGELIGGVENILVTDNLFAADGAADSAVLVDIQPGNAGIVEGASIQNFLAQLPNMNMQGKVWEAVVPVIKRANSIVEITVLT